MLLNIMLDRPTIEFAGSFSHVYKMPVQRELYLQESRCLDMTCSLPGLQVLCLHCACATTTCLMPTTTTTTYQLKNNTLNIQQR